MSDAWMHTRRSMPEREDARPRQALVLLSVGVPVLVVGAVTFADSLAP